MDVKVGVFVTNLFDIDFSKRDVEVQFWVWFNHSSEKFDPKDNVEISNARSASQLAHYRNEVSTGVFWDQAKYYAVLNETWSIVNYPFDRQTIKLVLESSEADSRKVRFIPDVEGTKVREDLDIEGWKVEAVRITASDQKYHTAYGDPTLSVDGPSLYPRVTIEIDVKRDGWRLLLNSFIGFALAIALAGIVLASIAVRRFTHAIEIGPQLTIGTGALFSTIGAGYILQNGLPATTEFSLADAFQLTAFAVTFLTMLSVFVVHVMKTHGRAADALVVGRVLFAVYASILLMIFIRVIAAVSS